MNRHTPLAGGLTFGMSTGLAQSRPSAHWTQTVWAGPWPGVAGALAVFALLLAFSHVVSLGVQQGELRRQAMARQASLLWRCDAAQPRPSGPCAAEPGPGDVREASLLLPSAPSSFSAAGLLQTTR